MTAMLLGAIPRLEEAMRFRLVRQAALAANVANADTPGYRRVDLTFEASLRRAAGALERTHPQHLAGAGNHGVRIVRGPVGARPDGNGVDRDRELIRMVRNAGAFQDQAAVLARVYSIRRVAVTGEPR